MKEDATTTSGGETVSVAYRYDDNGNTIARIKDGTEETTYVWDYENRLVEVRLPDGSVIGYVYGDDGIRVSTTVNGVTTHYLVDQNRPYAQVLEEYVAGELEVRYAYGHDLISQKREGETRFYQVDGLGSTRVLTNETGGVVQTYTYDGFGELIESTGGVENSYQFAGEQYDEGLDQYYLRQRYYDSEIGRFTRRDTFEGILGEPNTLHKYVYTHNNPVILIDPLGLYSQEFGYGVEDVVQPIYLSEHPGNDISFGEVVYSKKPDILNKTKKTFNDIKPLSPKGILSATYALGEYTLTYGPRGYSADIFWKAPPNIIEAVVTRGEPREVPRDVIVFNAGGILFYTDQINNKNQILALGINQPNDFRSKVRPLLFASSLNSLNPLAQSNYLIDISRDLTAINTVLLASLVATAATVGYGYA